jgi:hypothetical protein
MPILKHKPLLVTDAMHAVDIQITARFENTVGGEKVADMSAHVTLVGLQSATDLVERAEIVTLQVPSVMALAQDPNSNMAKAYYFITAAINDEYARQYPDES